MMGCGAAGICAALCMNHYQSEFKTFIWWADGAEILGLYVSPVWSRQAVCVRVCVWARGKWIRLIRCGACYSEKRGGSQNSGMVRSLGLWWGEFSVQLNLWYFFVSVPWMCFCHDSFCHQSRRSGSVIMFLFFIGSARRKLTCTICNRKCSSSLNLQEHRKVSSTASAAQLRWSRSDTLHRLWEDLLSLRSFAWSISAVMSLFGCFSLCRGIHHALRFM